MKYGHPALMLSFSSQNSSLFTELLTRTAVCFKHKRAYHRKEAIRMPVSICGSWELISNVNFEGYMTALGISPCLRKIALKLRLKKVIEEHGDQYIIKTCSTFRNYTVSFSLGQEFEEFTQGLDNRHLKSLVTWQGNKLVCVQLGENKNRGWTHWIEEDKLHLKLYCEGEVCRQVFKKNVTE